MSPAHIANMARAVERNPAHIGVLSTGEALAVALVLNRADLLPREFTILQAVQRVVVGGWSLAMLEMSEKLFRERRG